MSKRKLYSVSVPVSAQATALVWADSEKDAIDKACEYAYASLCHQCGEMFDIDDVEWDRPGVEVRESDDTGSFYVANEEDGPDFDEDCEDCDADA
jgi:regulation of enolase protein 1 (concanavalin A-like superfamily)